MRDYMITLGSVMMMVSISEILIPDGEIKKFASLAMGFMLIAVVTSPLGKDGKFFEFKSEEFIVQKESMEEAEDLYEKKVLAKHKENLEKMIKEHIKHDSEVSVEVSEKGELDGVTLFLKGDESKAVSYIVETLRLPRGRITLVYEDN